MLRGLSCSHAEDGRGERGTVRSPQKKKLLLHPPRLDMVDHCDVTETVRIYVAEIDNMNYNAAAGMDVGAR